MLERIRIDDERVKGFEVSNRERRIEIVNCHTLKVGITYVIALYSTSGAT